MLKQKCRRADRSALAAIFGALQEDFLGMFEAVGHTANNGSVFGEWEASLVILGVKKFILVCKYWCFSEITARRQVYQNGEKNHSIITGSWLTVYFFFY